jgi:hypothetical protein
MLTMREIEPQSNTLVIKAKGKARQQHPNTGRTENDGSYINILAFATT